MVILRTIAIALIVFALMLFGADAVSTLESNGIMVVRSLNQVLMLLGLDASALFVSYAPTQVATVAVQILNWPGWSTLGTLGVILAALTYRRSEDAADGGMVR